MGKVETGYTNTHIALSQKVNRQYITGILVLLFGPFEYAKI